MTISLQRMVQWRAGLHVRRYHIVPTIGEQTVGHHSAGVALIIMMCHPTPSAELLKAALSHDLPEGQIGDIPAQTRWADATLSHIWTTIEHGIAADLDLPWEAMLTKSELVCLKIADCLELVWWAWEQTLMGNANYRRVAQRGDEFLCSGLVDWTLAPVGFAKLHAELHNTLFSSRLEVYDAQ